MKLNFNQAYALFLQDKTAECNQKTLLYYIGCLRIFQTFITLHKELSLEELYLDDITIYDLKEFLIYLRNKDKYEGNIFIDKEKHVNERLCRTSIKSYQRGVKVFFAYCYRENLMNYDITSNYRLIKSEKKEKIPLYASEVAEIDALYNSKTETGSRNLCIIHVMLDTGARMSELINLKICDVMFDKNLILLDGKGNKQRVVPLGKRLRKLLMNYLVKYRRISVDQQGNPVNFLQDSVFLSLKTREPITETAIKMMFRRIKQKTGIQRIHAHLLRHTFATSYMLQGGDLESLRIFLGHEDLTTTSIYLHLANKYRMLNSDVYTLDIVFKRTF